MALTQIQKTFTAPGTSEPVIVDTLALSKWGLEVDVDPGVSAWNVELQGSIMGVSFKQMITHKSGFFNDDDLVWDQTPKPVNWIRFELISMTGTGEVRCHAIGQT